MVVVILTLNYRMHQKSITRQLSTIRFIAVYYINICVIIVGESRFLCGRIFTASSAVVLSLFDLAACLFVPHKPRSLYQRICCWRLMSSSSGGRSPGPDRGRGGRGIATAAARATPVAVGRGRGRATYTASQHLSPGSPASPAGAPLSGATYTVSQHLSPGSPAGAPLSGSPIRVPDAVPVTSVTDSAQEDLSG